MLAIKLRRIGKKRQPSYRLVVTEKRGKPHTIGVEDLGWYEPRSKKFEMKRERMEYWLKVGAQPTDTAHNLLVRAGILQGKKIAVHAKPRAKAEGAAPSDAPKAEAPKAEQAAA